MNNEDIANIQFNELMAIKYLHHKNGHAIWLFQCSCGKLIENRKNRVMSGNSKSCGHLLIQFNKSTKTIHGKTNSRLFNIWRGMKARCYNKNNKDYIRYGGRNIKIYQEWKQDFKVFYYWSINNGYQDNLQINRIDNDDDYKPNNCNWVTSKENSNNKRNSKLITYNNRTQTLSQWAEELNINRTTLSERFRHGWPVDKVLGKSIK
jgi:hypothetical protein